MPISNTNWSDSGTPANSQWTRPSGIDTSVPTYDDATISYDDSSEYYDGYDATTITVDDVKFDNWTDSGAPSKSTWTDAG